MNTPKLYHFYLIVGILMFIGALGTLYNLVYIWDISNIGQRISVMSSFLINLIFSVSFFVMYKNTKKQTLELETVKGDIDEASLKEFLTNIQNGNTKQNRSTKKE